jgi:hypothetical protein
MIGRSLDEIRARAAAELATNPTITVYTIDELGRERRRPANPFAGLRAGILNAQAAFRRLGEAVVSVSASFAGFSDSLRDALGEFPR